MKQLIEELLEKSGKSKVELAAYLEISRQGLDYKLKNDAFKHGELSKLSVFFDVDANVFFTEGVDMEKAAQEPSLWERVVHEKDLRIEELMDALRDARYTIQLQKRLMGESFLNVSELTPVPFIKKQMAVIYKKENLRVIAKTL